MKFAALALLGAVSASSISRNQEKLYEIMALQTESQQVDANGCPIPLEITEDEMQYQLGEFSRNFNMENWKNAMKIKEELE